MSIADSEQENVSRGVCWYFFNQKYDSTAIDIHENVVIGGMSLCEFCSLCKGFQCYMLSRYTQNVTFWLAGFPKPFLATVTNYHYKGVGKRNR